MLAAIFLARFVAKFIALIEHNISCLTSPLLTTLIALPLLVYALMLDDAWTSQQDVAFSLADLLGGYAAESIKSIILRIPRLRKAANRLLSSGKYDLAPSLAFLLPYPLHSGTSED